MPVIAFNVLTHRGVSTLWALVIGGIFPAINIGRGWLKSHRLDPLGIIVLSFIAVGTATSLISGSVFFALIKESFITATFGLMFLGSLLAERPLMFYIARQFVAGDDQARIEWWNGLWQYPGFRSTQRLITGVWGVAYVIEAFVRVGFALTLRPATVVVLSPMMGVGVTIVLIMWTRRYSIAARDRRMREMQLAQAG